MRGEKRKLFRDLYGLYGRFAGGEVVDELVAGTVVTVGRDERGRPCLSAGDRVYPLDPWLARRVRQASVPFQESEEAA